MSTSFEEINLLSNLDAKELVQQLKSILEMLQRLHGHLNNGEPSTVNRQPKFVNC